MIIYDMIFKNSIENEDPEIRDFWDGEITIAKFAGIGLIPMMFWTSRIRPQNFTIRSVNGSCKKRLNDFFSEGSVLNKHSRKALCQICFSQLGDSDVTNGLHVWPEKCAHYVLNHDVWMPIFSTLPIFPVDEEIGKRHNIQTWNSDLIDKRFKNISYSIRYEGDDASSHWIVSIWNDDLNDVVKERTFDCSSAARNWAKMESERIQRMQKEIEAI